MVNPSAPIAVGVLELQVGDVVANPFMGEFLYVCRGTHPIWSNLQAVVWCKPDGKLIIDALQPHQRIAGGVVNRHESPEERARRFRMWYFDKQGNPR